MSQSSKQGKQEKIAEHRPIRKKKFRSSILQMPRTVEPQRIRRFKNRNKMSNDFRNEIRELYHQTDYLINWNEESVVGLVKPIEYTSIRVVMGKSTPCDSLFSVSVKSKTADEKSKTKEKEEEKGENYIEEEEIYIENLKIEEEEEKEDESQLILKNMLREKEEIDKIVEDSETESDEIDYKELANRIDSGNYYQQEEKNQDLSEPNEIESNQEPNEDSEEDVQYNKSEENNEISRDSIVDNEEEDIQNSPDIIIEEKEKNDIIEEHGGNDQAPFVVREDGITATITVIGVENIPKEENSNAIVTITHFDKTGNQVGNKYYVDPDQDPEQLVFNNIMPDDLFIILVYQNAEDDKSLLSGIHLKGSQIDWSETGTQFYDLVSEQNLRRGVTTPTSDSGTIALIFNALN